MSLAIELIKTPYEVAFTGNPIAFLFACTPYGSTERSQDIRLSVRIEVEDNFNSGIFVEKKNDVFYPDANGEVFTDISSIIDAYVDFKLPSANNTFPFESTEQRKRYRLQYLLQLNNEAVGTTQTTDIFFAIKGGLSVNQYKPTLFFSQYILQNKNPLNYYTAKQTIHPEELKYLYWLYPNNDNEEMVVEFTVHLSDGTTATQNITNNFRVGKWGVCAIAVGLNQAQLNTLVPSGLYAVKIVVNVVANTIPVIEPQTYYIDHRQFYNTYQLLYRTSTGAFETIRLRGVVDFEADYDRQNATRTTAPNWYQNLQLQPQAVNLHTDELLRFKGDTGFMQKNNLEALRDLFLSTQVVELQQNNFLPVLVQGKSVKFFSNRDSLFALQIDWQRAYLNNYYTPDSIYNSISCPGMEKLVVKQRNKNTLQIMFAAPLPYDLVEIEINNGTPSQLQTFTINKNAGSITAPFTNPATTTPVEITIRARVICNNTSVPIDAGAYTTVTLEVSGNSLPVANTDTYNILAGATTPQILIGSVLANDYDPDGDALAVVVAGAATTAGGAYTIDAAGIITYTRPSSSFNGADSFTYQLEQASTPTGVFGTVNINVGATPSGVYAKLVYRNTVGLPSAYGSSLNGEVWIDFFADPSGTVPLDVTAYALTVNHRVVEYTQTNTGTSSSTTTNSTVNPTGDKVKIFEGLINENNYDPADAYPSIFDLTFSVQPGTGYSVI